MERIRNASTPRILGYWIATGLLTTAFALGGVNDLRHTPELLAVMGRAGYPFYFVAVIATLHVLLSTWRVLAAALLVGPWLPKRTAWIYGAIALDLTAVALAHGASGDDGLNASAPVVALGVLALSWATRKGGRCFVVRALGHASAQGVAAVEGEPARTFCTHH